MIMNECLNIVYLVIMSIFLLVFFVGYFWIIIHLIKINKEDNKTSKFNLYVLRLFLLIGIIIFTLCLFRIIIDLKIF